MSTYLLVHGGWHGGWCWGRVTPLLREAGHEVFTPTLTGLGERAHLLSPEIDLDTHIRDVLGVIKYEDLHDLILVGHSYAGMIITAVAEQAVEEVGATLNQVIIAWMRQSDPPVLPIVAGSRPEQLLENVAALDITLDENQMERLNTAGNPDVKKAWLR